MKDAPTFAIGDRVRVVIEGEITSNPLGGYAEVAGGYYIPLGEDFVISVEVTAKVLAVGATLTSEQFGKRDWEPGSVVIDDEDDVMVFCEYGDDGEQSWMSSTEGNWWSTRRLAGLRGSITFRVLHLP